MGNTYKSYFTNLFRLQKRALRLWCDGRSMSTNNLFVKFNRLPLAHLHSLQVAKLVHTFIYNVHILPKCITSLFQCISDIHHHLTRSLDSRCLHTHYGRLIVRNNSVKIYAPRLWNKIPPQVRQINLLHTFKTLHSLYLLSDA